MSRNRKTTSVSRIERPRPVPYSRRMKSGGEIVEDAGESLTMTDKDTTDAPKPDAPAPAGESKPKKHEQKSAAKADAPTPDDATTEKRRPHSSTMEMPVNTIVGQPPAMPVAAAPVATPPVEAPAAIAAPVKPGEVEDPTFMPPPKYIPAGNPADPALPPGRVPRGDSRSFRRAEADAFALVYRVGTFVISRFGTVGTRGQWRVVEYPTSSSASHAYAKECSRFVTEGFSDYRDS